jgi:hypothetical protein
MTLDVALMKGANSSLRPNYRYVLEYLNSLPKSETKVKLEFYPDDKAIFSALPFARTLIMGMRA